ncbi:MAG: hypothetical protein C0501_26180 [Isosphaera sp.]|nr:hypothetical protein [Isosphaera sp.]
MSRLVWPAAVAAAVLFAAAATAQKTAVKATKEWNGSVADEALAKDAPACVTSAKGLEALWKAWGLADKAPAVDFAKEMVVVTTTRGSKVRLAASLDEKGNLAVLGLGTRDLAPGFRYVLATVPRDGVKTVNGKELPKE